MHRTTPSLRYALKTDRKGVEMTLIGEWIDLAAYYAGSDGNAWTFNAATGTWSNAGEIDAFKSNFEQRFRGALFPQAQQ